MAKCLLRECRAVRASHGLASSETASMKKPPTGEPYAGKPPVRFGGRGRRKPIPTPIMRHHRSADGSHAFRLYAAPRLGLGDDCRCSPRTRLSIGQIPPRKYDRQADNKCAGERRDRRDRPQRVHVAEFETHEHLQANRDERCRNERGQERPFDGPVCYGGEYDGGGIDGYDGPHSVTSIRGKQLAQASTSAPEGTFSAGRSAMPRSIP